MCRNIVSEGVLNILNEKQNAEGSYISCGPALTPQGLLETGGPRCFVKGGLLFVHHGWVSQE